MGLLVRLEDWVFKKRPESAFFSSEWGFQTMQGQDFAADRTVSDVLQIFQDVTEVRLERADEDFIIRHWLKQGWTNHDFRMLIEYHFHSPKEREFLDQPGRMNLRMMLNTSRAQRLMDILRDLRFQHGRRAKKELDRSLPSVRPLMVMPCGSRVPLGDKSSYDLHMQNCFLTKGACFHS